MFHLMNRHTIVHRIYSNKWYFVYFFNNDIERLNIISLDIHRNNNDKNKPIERYGTYHSKSHLLWNHSNKLKCIKKHFIIFILRLILFYIAFKLTMS